MGSKKKHMIVTIIEMRKRKQGQGKQWPAKEFALRTKYSGKRKNSFGNFKRNPQKEKNTVDPTPV